MTELTFLTNLCAELQYLEFSLLRVKSTLMEYILSNNSNTEYNLNQKVFKSHFEG